MTIVLNRQLFNTLPSLGEASATFASKGTGLTNCMNGAVQDLFLKYSLEKVFTLYLQHRHHFVDSAETIVKVQGTAHVMDACAISDIMNFGNTIKPSTWMMSEGKAHPMEFSVTLVTDAEIHAVPPSNFVDELASILASNGFDDIFGLDSVAEQDWVELTVGNASVVVPSISDNGGEVFKEYIPVSFAFGREDPKFQVHGKCKKDHRHTSEPPKK